MAPPRYIRVQVGSGEVLLAGQAELGRGRCELMPHEAIHAFCESLVERRFEIHAKRLVPLVANGGHPFGSGERAPVDMRCAGGLLHKEAIGVARAMLRGHSPVFGLRDGA